MQVDKPHLSTFCPLLVVSSKWTRKAVSPYGKDTHYVDWSQTLKAAIKEKGVPAWVVRRQIRQQGPPSGSPRRWRQGQLDQDAWTSNGRSAASVPSPTWLADLHQRVEDGATLDQAWAQLHPEEIAAAEPGTPNAITGINWKAIELAYYRDRERNGTKIGTKTMEADKRYCSKAVELLKEKTALNTPYKLIDATIDAGGWTDKARARQQCVDAVVRMLAYGVDHQGLDESWLIRQSQKLKLKGDGKQDEERPVKALTDAQVIALLEAAENCKAPRWKNVLLLMAVYGLRPIEVLHLEVRVKVNPKTKAKKRQLYCKYEKACGGKTKKVKTPPRFLYACPPRNEDGTDYCGDLTAAFEANLLPFPPMGRGAADINQHLARNPVWRQIREEAEKEGKQLRPYSFRNSYSVRCHARNVPSAQVADAMGHSDLTHNAFYLTSTVDATAAAFEAMNEGS